MASEDVLTKKKHRKSKKSKIISFDEEVVTKDIAADILLKTVDNEQLNVASHEARKKKNKKNRATENIRKKRESSNLSDNNVTEEQNLEDSKPLPKKKKEPILGPGETVRSQKRERYKKLSEEKKNQNELLVQQKGINYLSKWKHSRQEWKFEKLRQIWLQQNLYDSAKIPKTFWETAVEYFSHSKGKTRDVLLNEALKLVEENEEKSGEIDEEMILKLERARDIIQSLQE